MILWFEPALTVILHYFRYSMSQYDSKHMSHVMTKPTKWLCAKRRLRSAWASAQSDQSLLSTWRNLGSLATHSLHSQNSDQTGRIPRLIWVFAGRTCHFIGFDMWRLIWKVDCFRKDFCLFLIEITSKELGLLRHYNRKDVADNSLLNEHTKFCMCSFNPFMPGFQKTGSLQTV